jgi:outer membrane protein assembly factor BamA
MYAKKVYLVAITMLVILGDVSGQNDTSKSDPYEDPTYSVRQLDIYDVVDWLFKINIANRPDTAKILPWRMLFSGAPAFGYTLEGGYQGCVSGNISFYTGGFDTTNLSVIKGSVQFSQMKQFIIPLISNVWLPGNRFDLLCISSYYMYPSYTYGLGSNTSYHRADYVYYDYIKFYPELLRHFASYYYAGLGYNLDYHYNIHELHESVTDFPVYSDDATKTVSSGVLFHFIYDNRVNINNPKKAFYGSVIYRYNSTLLGSDVNWQYIQLEARKYFLLSPNKVLALWSWNEFTFGGKAPYYDLPSTGWDTYSNTGRGYIQSRFRGPAMIYGEAELRFGILKNGLLGGVIFANATSVSNWPDKVFNAVFPGEGVGLRLKFNKYSGVNVCIDYAFGEQGSHGFFFNLGEVF